MPWQHFMDTNPLSFWWILGTIIACVALPICAWMERPR